MGDTDRGAAGINDEDRLPWLEAVEDEDEGEGVGAGKLVAAVIAALVALGLVIGGVFWMRQRSQPQGDGTLIAAPQGGYKIAPNANEAGNAVEGEGDATYAASQGANVSSTIDTTKLPEAPVTKTNLPASSAAPAPAPAPPPVVKPVAPVAVPASTAKPAPEVKKPEAKAPPAPKPAAPKPAPKPVLQTTPAEASRGAPPTAGKPASSEGARSEGGASKQIGAYSSETKAKAGEKDLLGRFPALHGLSLSIEQGTSRGKTVYRIFMRGGPNKVEAVCKALHSAKEGCIPG